MDKKHIKVKYRNVGLALAGILLMTLALTTPKAPEKENKKNTDTSSAVETKVRDKTEKKSTPTDKITWENFENITLQNGDSMSSGNLVLVDKNHNYTGSMKERDNIYPYLFNEGGEQIIATSSTNLYGEKECLKNFNRMAVDFSKETSLNSLMIYSAEGEDTENCYEHKTGLAVDLHIYNESDGTYPELTKENKYAWIYNNCCKYGFIQRYTGDKKNLTGMEENTYHFRYVGNVYAGLMKSKNMCFEEFLEFIKDYGYQNPLKYTCEDGVYGIYYCKAANGTTTSLPLPVNEKSEKYKYKISGNNVDGYIVLITVSGGKDDDNEESSAAESTVSESSFADTQTNYTQTETDQITDTQTENNYNYNNQTDTQYSVTTTTESVAAFW